jgi:hypothetical protein
MKTITIFPLLLLFLSAGAVKSQAPLSGTPLSNLELMEQANKTLIDQQTKTLQVLDKLDQDAAQLKIFTNRG